ncbi:MAG TPA: hypothetical protein VGN07_16235 [Steroidobacteraceae bacterium]|jgi:hypothetical protein
MARLERFESRVSLRVVAGVLSVALHLGLFFLLVFSGARHDGMHDGDTPITRLVLLESRHADRRDGIESPPREPTNPAFNPSRQLSVDNSPPPSLPVDELQPESAAAIVTQPDAIAAPTDTLSTDAVEPAATFVMPQAARPALMQRLARLAEVLAKTPQAQVTWEQDGKQYQAELVLERAKNGIEFDRVVAEVSAEDHGKQLTTHIKLKRLAFSHYTQMVDRWDPMVQLHDDEIVGRFHVNSQFNLMYDRRTIPTFLGKVTTAASRFSTQASGRRREADIFRGGIETGAGLIAMPEELRPLEWAPRDEKARKHEFANDTRIRFFGDGSYSWRNRNTDTAEYRNEPTTQPVYFIATGRATLYVQGIVSGKVLIYSPRKIVVEGSVTYAHDPRRVPDSGDYLGLVSNGYVEVAPPDVTGPGDLDIHAAIFAGQRFVVRDIDQRRSATLRIYGSLAAGSVSATEPRYATKIEYDSRFEQQRPPGFPSTSRFAAEDWDGLWTEAPKRAF